MGALSSDLPDELTTFLRDHVSSYEELETLLFLAQAPARSWSVADVAAALKATPHFIQSALEALAAEGSLVQRVSGAARAEFRYEPATEAGRELVTQLRRAYVDQRLAIVQVMNANALERVRSSAPRRLAEAFRFDRSKK